MKLKPFLTIFLIALTGVSVSAQTLVRQPYLQLSTTNSVVIRWR